LVLLGYPVVKRFDILGQIGERSFQLERVESLGKIQFEWLR
jgi:hypothetical protein